MGFTDFDDLVAALHEIAGKDEYARTIVRFVSERGVHVPLTRHLEPYPEISEAEFNSRIDEANRWSEKLGLGSLPTDYGELKRLIEDAEKTRTPSFRLHLPEGWDTSRLALVPVEDDALPFYLPGVNLAAFGTDYDVHAEPIRVVCHRLCYATSVPCTRFWLALTMLETAALAREELGRLDRGEASVPDARQLIDRLRGAFEPDAGNRAPSPESIRSHIRAIRFSTVVVNRRLGGTLIPSIEAFAQSGSLGEPAYFETCRTFLAGQFEREFGPPESKVEETRRAVFATFCVLAQVSSTEALISFLGRNNLWARTPFSTRR